MTPIWGFLPNPRNGKFQRGASGVDFCHLIPDLPSSDVVVQPDMAWIAEDLADFPLRYTQRQKFLDALHILVEFTSLEDARGLPYLHSSCFLSSQCLFYPETNQIPPQSRQERECRDYDLRIVVMDIQVEALFDGNEPDLFFEHLIDDLNNLRRASTEAADLCDYKCVPWFKRVHQLVDSSLPVRQRG